MSKRPYILRVNRINKKLLANKKILEDLRYHFSINPLNGCLRRFDGTTIDIKVSTRKRISFYDISFTSAEIFFLLTTNQLLPDLSIRELAKVALEAQNRLAEKNRNSILRGSK
jgi:hypothetical protein